MTPILNLTQVATDVNNKLIMTSDGANLGVPVRTNNPPVASGSDNNDCVFKVSVRAPPFWPEEPSLWFAQMEAQFSLSGITSDSTKFNYVIAQLEHQYVVEVKEIINNPPADNKYSRLKTELISRLSASQEKKVLQLMKHEELGERKPSQFLRHLRTLAGRSVTEDFLKTVWSSRLPNSLQAVVACQTNATLDDLAELADKVHDIVPQAPQVYSLGGSEQYVTEMAKQIAMLTKEIASLKANFGDSSRPSRSSSHSGPRNRHRNSSASSSRRRDRSSSKWDTSVCWYHNRFGDRATRCTRPCNHPSTENFNGSRK